MNEEGSEMLINPCTSVIQNSVLNFYKGMARFWTKKTVTKIIEVVYQCV